MQLVWNVAIIIDIRLEQNKTNQLRLVLFIDWINKLTADTTITSLTLPLDTIVLPVQMGPSRH